MKQFLFTLILAISIVNIYAQQAPNTNRRLLKSVLKSPAVNEEYLYSYDEKLRIKKIVHSQEGKLSSTTESFTFNDSGLVTSYIRTYNLDISPEKTTIIYDAKNNVKSIEINRTKHTKKQDFASSWQYERNVDTLTVIDTRFFLGKVPKTYLYVFNSDGNVLKKKGLGDPNSVNTTIYSQYDTYHNPQTLTGGYIDEHVLSPNNFKVVEYVGIYTINSSIEYYTRTTKPPTPGGAKIPSQQINMGVVKKITETSYDKDAKRTFVVGTTTYTYINL